MVDNLKYHEMAREMLDQLPRGAFLSVKAGERINTMTIGWGAIGYMWQKPVLIVMVRYSRYTHELISQAQEFSVSVPQNNDFKKSLAVAGSKSGRDMDKFQELNLTITPGQKTEAPVIAGCGLVYECRILYRQALDPEGLNEAIKSKFYSDEDYHVLYFGEILACYEN
jgi:flavin reductase (DIM6/NTAB) family NADH-FMN oxidoreductase RutF